MVPALRSVVLSVVVLVSLLPYGESAADEPITCTGMWSPALSEQVLVRAFGRENVVKGMVYVAEGEEVPGTVVFPKDRSRRLEVVWRDQSRRVTVARIRNGLSLGEVEKLNGRPFSLYGFDWDYGGTVTSWRGGRLNGIGPDCALQVPFERTVPERVTSAQQSALDSTSGDHEILSSSSALKAFPVSVNEIVIQYRE